MVKPALQGKPSADRTLHVTQCIAKVSDADIGDANSLLENPITDGVDHWSAFDRLARSGAQETGLLNTHKNLKFAIQ